MPTLLDQVRAASAEERRSIFSELAKEQLANARVRGPLVVTDEGTSAPIAYLTPTLAGECLMPEITDDVLAKVRERARNPGKLLTVEQALQRLDDHIAERQRAEGESPR